MKFEVGEIAVITRSLMPQFPVGMEVTILEICEPFQADLGCQYVIWREEGLAICANDECLRKKRPPEELGEWELCPWRPKAVPAPQFLPETVGRSTGRSASANCSG
jgi:hypothetical protein